MRAAKSGRGVDWGREKMTGRGVMMSETFMALS